MSLYARYILPHLIDLAMRNKETTCLRAAWIPHASGDVLEIGIGSGLNLPFYSARVQHIYGVDPSLELQRMARTRAAVRVDVEFVAQSAEEHLWLSDASVDTIVMTWTLCSIPNAGSALRQMKRVTKPGGRHLFIEAGAARFQIRRVCSGPSAESSSDWAVVR